ncbi:MAG: (d)CMP kinase [Nitrospirota bacterium]|nr:(d)CMP kinase [Nitrospirota bacterium]
MITIDGPAGVGKSTVSKCLAGRLHYGYLDTGALYRVLAWKVQQEKLEPSNLSHIESLLSRTSLQLIADQNGFSIKIDGQPVIEKELRTPVISQLASSIAVLPIVREWLLPVQQAVGKSGGVVAEGRDMGTRVFPDADLKFFLEADVNVRARRRQQELAGKGQHVHLDTVRDDMVMRDTRDRTRALDPLRPAPEAIMIETSQKSIEDIVSHMMGMIADRL